MGGYSLEKLMASEENYPRERKFRAQMAYGWGSSHMVCQSADLHRILDKAIIQFVSIEEFPYANGENLIMNYVPITDAIRDVVMALTGKEIEFKD